MRGSVASFALVGAACAAAAGCQLREITLAAPEDVIVAEVVLQAGGTLQLAWLHRTLGSDSLAVPGATVEVTGPGGRIVAFRPAGARVCVDSSAAFAPDTSGSCYSASTAASAIAPGESYTLDIVTAEGRRLTGTTTVPGPLRLTRPASLGGEISGEPACALPAATLLPLTWTRSSGAWVYVSETRMLHVRRAFDPASPDDRPLDLVGLSVSAADTTIVFPSEFGLFDRADSASAPLLRALQGGLPEGVSATVTIAAADRNYVDWVRRGSFNPSGVVQIPSIRGDGTGVFGSVVPVRLAVTSSAGSSLPLCTS